MCDFSRDSVQLFSSLPSVKKGGFDFREGESLMTHQVTPQVSQFVACSLLTSHFWICLDLCARYYDLIENLMDLMELCRADPSQD